AHVPFDNTQSNRTGIAIATLQENPIQLTLWDQDGNQVDTKTLEFGEFEQRSVFLHDEFPAALGQRGFVTVEAPAEFHMLVLNQDVQSLLLSTSVAMPGVLERLVEINIPQGETSQWVLRLVQDGFFLYGSADEVGGEPTFASGILTDGFFQLNIHLVSQTNESLVICLLANEAPNSFEGFSGSATQLQQDGSVSETGTFEVTRPDNAQF
ncbi:MAG TPA: hypothetical protein VKZ59_05460, partial [Acidobacteriota bacterium]|nr:hypothetical protein [Acidobacteriota bacterium]